MQGLVFKCYPWQPDYNPMIVVIFLRKSISILRINKEDANEFQYPLGLILIYLS